jgi:chromosome segregation ATPase
MNKDELQAKCDRLEKRCETLEAYLNGVEKELQETKTEKGYIEKQYNFHKESLSFEQIENKKLKSRNAELEKSVLCLACKIAKTEGFVTGEKDGQCGGVEA